MLMNFFTRAVLGTDFYHIIQWFLVYGILGWIVESVYMSICNRKLTIVVLHMDRFARSMDLWH